MKKSAALCLLLFAAAALSAKGKEADSSGEIKKDGWNFGPLPCISYNSDLGFQYGICADIFNYKGVFPDYRQRFYVELSRYTKGQTLAHVQFDSRYLIPGIRTTFSASYQYDPMFLFYGLNGLEPYNPDLDCNKDSRTARYDYQRSMVRVLTNFQGPITGKLEWTAGIHYWYYNLNDIDVEDYDPDKTLYWQMKEKGVFRGDGSAGRTSSRVQGRCGLRHQGQSVGAFIRDFDGIVFYGFPGPVRTGIQFPPAQRPLEALSFFGQ